VQDQERQGEQRDLDEVTAERPKIAKSTFWRSLMKVTRGRDSFMQRSAS